MPPHPPPFLPTPQIPAGMDPDTWTKGVQSLADEGARVVAALWANPGSGIGGKGSGFGAGSAFSPYVAMLQSLYGLTTDAAVASAHLMTTQALPGLQDALQLNQAQAEAMATASSENLADWLKANGHIAVPDTGGFAAALARGQAAMLSDWASLSATTQHGVASAVANGLALGQSPQAVAKRVHQALLDTGNATYARGLLIARTEMADMQSNAFLADLAGNPSMKGWWWKARPDACPVCQVQNGRRWADTDHMNQHHMCRCVMVPIVFQSPEERIKRGNYIKGEQRSQADVLDPPKATKRGSKTQAGIPKAWRDDLPKDLRELVDQKPNEGWRPSWQLVKPGTPRGPVTPLEPITPKPVKPKPLPKEPFGKVPSGLRAMDFPKETTTYSQGRGFAWDGPHVEDFRVGVNRTKDGTVLQFKATDKLHQKLMQDAPALPTTPTAARVVPDMDTLGFWAKEIVKDPKYQPLAKAEVNWAAGKYPDYDPAKHATSLKPGYEKIKGDLEMLAKEAQAALDRHLATKAVPTPVTTAAPAVSPWRIEGEGKMRALVPDQDTNWSASKPSTDGEGFSMVRDLGDGMEVRYSSSVSPFGLNLQYTYRNTMQVFVPDGVDPKEALRRLDSQLGITAHYPKDAELLTAAENKLIFGMDWEEANAVRAGTSTDASRKASLDRIKAEWGVTGKDVAWETDWYGQPMAVLPDAVTDAIARQSGTGAFHHEFLGGHTDWIGVMLGDAERPPLMLASNHRRYADNLGVRGGISESTDTRSGGGEYVFLRQRGSMPRGDFEGVLFDAKPVLRRLDRYSYSRDSFGVLNQGHSQWRGRHTPGMEGLKAKTGSRETMVKGRLEIPEGGLRLGDYKVEQLVRAAHGRGEWNQGTLDRFKFYIRKTDGTEYDWTAMQAQARVPRL